MNAQKRTRQNPLAGEYKFPVYGLSKKQIERGRKALGLPPLDEKKDRQTPSGFSVKVDAIHIVRYKKLKGGKLAIRSRKVIRCGRTVIEDGKVTVTYVAKNGEGKLIGTIDTAAGVINLHTESFIPAGYAKGRGFVVVGYNCSANITNTNRRPLHMGAR